MDNAPVSFGLGVYTPYGLSLNWGNNNPFRTTAEYGKLLYACINPVVAWKVCPTLSIAAGTTLNYSQATLRQGLGFFPGDQFKFKGDGFAAGFNGGILWQPLTRWSFGVNYRSATEIDYRGHSQTSPTGPPPFYPSTSTHGSIKFPQFIVGGVSFRPTPDWNFEFDLDWTEWDHLNTSTLHGSPLGPVPIVFNYRNSFMYDFGITRQLGKGYFANLGFIYSEKSVPDKYFNPIVPDSDLYLPGVGFGYHGQRWDWAIAYHCGISGTFVIRNNVNPAVDGAYKTFNNAVNVAVGLKF
jgi:long-chain fatty acid transport protein